MGRFWGLGDQSQLLHRCPAQVEPISGSRYIHHYRCFVDIPGSILPLEHEEYGSDDGYLLIVSCYHLPCDL